MNKALLYEMVLTDNANKNDGMTLRHEMRQYFVSCPPTLIMQCDYKFTVC